MVDELIEPSLLHGKEFLDDDIVSLKDFLHLKRVEDLRKIVVNVSIELTDAMQNDIAIERLIGMAKIGMTCKTCV